MNKSTLIIAPLMLLIGVGAGYYLFGGESVSTVAIEEKRQPLFYRNPMNPNVTSPIPAKGSMGMDYIPVYANSEQGSNDRDVAGTVTIDPVVVQNMGVRTTQAKKIAISRTIRTVGRVAFDEERMTRLHPKVEGWVEEIRVNKTGQNVAKDDILLSIYSPKLVSTQQEYLLALNNITALEKSPFEEIRRGAEELAKSSRERLMLLDVPEHQIHELEKTRTVRKNLHIHSPTAGTVISIGSRQGQFVTPKTELYMMVDLNQVWVYADVYEYELPWVKIGDEVEMTLTSVPGRTFKGSLSYIYPYAEAKTRTTKVRLIFDNREQLLRPDMFAKVSIQSNTMDEAVVIPSEAIVRSGVRTQVFLLRGPGKFEPRMVKLGIESNGQVAVLEGVEAGDEVVTSAQFLLDSESKLREATAKMMEVLKGSTEKHNSMGAYQEKENVEAVEHSAMSANENAGASMSSDMNEKMQADHHHD
jgi:Cu(I)/Ag(I) efflux system membrane fusion protein